MEKHKSKVAILILMVMLITGITSVIEPTLVYAGINHNTGLGDSNPSGKGSETWVYPGEGVKPYGMRISLYHAPSLDVFNGVSGDKSQIKKVGQTREFTTYMPAAKYATQHSTGMSAVDYMTFGKDQDIRYHTWVYDGYHRTIGGPLVAKMPEILNSSTEDWRVFFAGKDHQNNPDYTNVSAILKEMGVTLSPEDFKNGIRRDKFGNTQRGVYKLFWEPVAYFRAGGFNSAFTFRDMAVWEQKFLPRKNNRDVASFYLGDTGADISNQNRSVIANTGNSHFLAEDEPALGMKGKPKGYRVPNTSKEQRLAVQKGTTGWLSMGVGVLTPKPVEAPKNKVLVSYVKVVDYKDGKFVYETIKETEEEAVKYIKGKESEGILDIDAVREVEEGTAVLNDVITTKNDYTEKVVEKKKEIKDLVWETGIQPKLKEEPVVEPEEVYGRLHGIVLHSVDEEIEKIEKKEDEVVEEEIEEVIVNAAVPVMAMGNLAKEMREVGVEASVKKANIRNKENRMTSTKETEPEKTEAVVLYDDFKKIAIQPAPVGEGGVEEIPNKAGNPKTEEKVTKNVIEGYAAESVNKAGTAEQPVVAHLRYIVLPESMQFHLTTKKIGDKVLTKTQENFKLPLDPDNPVNIPLKELHPKEKLVKWYIVPGGDIPDLTVSLPPKKPNTPESTETLVVPEITPGDNVVVIWEIIEEEPPVEPKGERVPEWRISKYNKELPGGLYARMGMTLKPDLGHKPTSLTPSGEYRFYRINPNNKRNDDSDSPANKKFQDWLHSKTIAKSRDTVTHEKPHAKIEVTGDLNLVKSTKLDGIKLAKWIKSNKDLSAYEVGTDFKGVPFGGPSDIEKSQKVTYGIENKDRYTHVYPVYYHPRIRKSRRCRCYQSDETPTPVYVKAERQIDSLFERYKQVETDKKVLNVAASKDEKNGITRVVMQQEKPITIYPEYPMLFQDNKGEHSIQVAVSDRGRQIKPVMYYTMEYNLFVEPKSTGTSVATDSRARQKAGTMGGGNKQVIHKGAGVNSSFNVTGLQGKDRGKLKITSYALDFSNKQVKEVWGNNWYSPEKINQDFLSKWSFKGEARENLVVSNPGGAGEAYIGPTKLKKTLEYTNKKQTKVENLKLEVRGAELYKVDNRLVETYKTGSQRDKDIYEALEKMRLVGKNKDETLFATFEQKAGRPLTEDLYKSMAAKSRNGHDKLEVGKGWYSEDTTVLELKVIHTELDIPSNMYADKLPMTIKGLQTPMNKNQFYSQMSKGHTRLNYLVKSADLGQGLGEVKSYFEVQSNKELQVKDKKLNKVTVDYLVPNVSITDTMGYN